MADETRGGRTTPSSASSGEKISRNTEVQLILNFLELQISNNKKLKHQESSAIYSEEKKSKKYQQLVKCTTYIVSLGREKVLNIMCEMKTWETGDISLSRPCWLCLLLVPRLE